MSDMNSFYKTHTNEPKHKPKPKPLTKAKTAEKQRDSYKYSTPKSPHAISASSRSWDADGQGAVRPARRMTSMDNPIARMNNNSYDESLNSQASVSSLDIPFEARRVNFSRGSLSGSPSSSDLGHLPSGWSSKVAPNGKTYFINDVDHTTTWIDPRTGRATPGTQGASARSLPGYEPDLPPGWEMAVTAKGVRYFIDHVNKRTTWKDPRRSMSAPASRLPSSPAHLPAGDSGYALSLGGDMDDMSQRVAMATLDEQPELGHFISEPDFMPTDSMFSDAFNTDFGFNSSLNATNLNNNVDSNNNSNHPGPKHKQVLQLRKEAVPDAVPVSTQGSLDELLGNDLAASLCADLKLPDYAVGEADADFMGGLADTISPEDLADFISTYTNSQGEPELSNF